MAKRIKVGDRIWYQHAPHFGGQALPGLIEAWGPDAADRRTLPRKVVRVLVGGVWYRLFVRRSDVRRRRGRVAGELRDEPQLGVGLAAPRQKRGFTKQYAPFQLQQQRAVSQKMAPYLADVLKPRLVKKEHP